MSFLYLTESSPGAPTLNGVNGSMCAVLDWALVAAGWAIEYTATNARIYRAASGNRRRLHVRHDSAASGDARAAVVRGCENASDATTLIDAFPSVAQLANANACWLASATLSAAARPYALVVTDTFFIFLTCPATAGQYSLNFFGDLEPENSEDDWLTVCTSRGTTATNGVSVDLFTAGMSIVPLAAGLVYACRDITGVVKGSRCNLAGGTPALGGSNTLPVARAGYLNRIEREKMSVSCSGGSSGTLGPTQMARRGWIPNLWNPLHNGPGALTEIDEFTDTAYNPGALFRPYKPQSTGFLILETTNTWSAPVG